MVVPQGHQGMAGEITMSALERVEPVVLVEVKLKLVSRGEYFPACRALQS